MRSREAVRVAVQGVGDPAQHHAQGQPGETPPPDEVPVGVRQEERVAAPRDEELLDRLEVLGLGIAPTRALRRLAVALPDEAEPGQGERRVHGLDGRDVGGERLREPPVATTRTGSPSSARMRPMMPCTISA